MRKRMGFTIIELLVVIVIISILAGILIPGVLAAQRKANRIACLNNLKQIGLTIINHSSDHNSAFPDLVDPTGVLEPGIADDGSVSTLPSRSSFALLMKYGYLDDPAVLICPESGDRLPYDFPVELTAADVEDLVPPTSGCSYGWDPTKKHSASSRCALAADKPDDSDTTVNSPNHGGDGQNVFFNGGRVAWLSTLETPQRVDRNIYEGEAGYETSRIDAKIVR